MLYNDIAIISAEAYAYCPKLKKPVDDAVKYYVRVKNVIDDERFKEQPSHNITTFTDATDNIAQSYFYDWLWFDEVYNGFGTVKKNCTTEELTRFIVDNYKRK